MQYQEVNPTSGNAKQLMVMLHGVGSDGNDLISLAPFFQSFLPDCYFFSPDAPEPYDMAPFGRQWFSLKDRSPKTIRKLVQKNTPILLDMIKAKQEDLGVGNKDTIILAFSQGTMIGSYATLIQENPFAAMICFSGRLVQPLRLENTATSFCMIHGSEDDIVPSDESIKMSDYCRENGIKNSVTIIPNLRHSIDASGIKFAKDFLLDILSL